MTIAELKEKLKQDRKSMNDFLWEMKKHPTRLINPKNQNKAVMCASVVAYIDNLIPCLEEEEESEGVTCGE